MNAPSSPMKKHMDLFFAKRSGVRVPADLPRLEGRAEVRWDADKIAAYRKVCGLPPRPTLPLLVPQIAAAKLHLDLFADTRFPFGALGIVHVQNHVELLEPLPNETVLELQASVSNCRATKGGWLFDLTTEASVRGTHKGRWVATILAKDPKASQVGGPPDAVPPAPATGVFPSPGGLLLRSSVVHAPENIGRLYGGIASDRNPIHQHALLAKPFGFKRAIAHGLWTLARTLAEGVDTSVDERSQGDSSDWGDGGVVLDCRFRRPIFLPGSFLVESYRSPAESLLGDSQEELQLMARPIPSVSGPVDGASKRTKEGEAAPQKATPHLEVRLRQR